MAKPINKKKWTIITIVSVLLIAAAVVAFILLVFPEYNKNQVIKGLEKSDKDMVASAYDKLPDSQKDKLKTDIDDFATYRINQYLNGEASYEEVDAQLDIIAQNIKVSDDYNTSSTKFYVYKLEQMTVDGMESDKIENRDFAEEISGKILDTGYAKEAYNGFYETYYNSYINDNIHYKKMINFQATAEAYGSALGANLPNEKRRDVTNCIFIDMDREFAKVAIDNGLYLDALKLYLSLYIGNADDPSDSNDVKKKKNAALEDAAFCKQKVLEQIDRDLTNGNVSEAKKSYDELVVIFGENDPELTVLADSFVPKWKEVYKDFVTGDYMARLTEDCDIGYIVENRYDSRLLIVSDYPIERVSLWDLDDNDVPELILYGSNNMTYFYTCENNELTFCGALKIISSVNDNEFIGAPYVDLGDGVKEIDVLFYSGGAWGISMAFVNDNGKYSVDGIEMGEDEFTEKLNEVEQNLTINTDNAYISVADNYIENWTK